MTRDKGKELHLIPGHLYIFVKHIDNIITYPCIFQSLRKEIEEKFNSGQFRWEDVRPHDAAGLLKQFLRDLPAPLLTYEYLDAFAQVERELELAIMFYCRIF